MRKFAEQEPLFIFIHTHIVSAVLAGAYLVDTGFTDFDGINIVNA